MLSCLIVRVTCIFYQFTYLINKITAILALVPYVADYQSFPCNGWNQSVLEKQHNSIQVGYFDQQALTFLVLQDSFQRPVHKVAFMHIRHESLELFVVVENRVEKLEESFDNLYV